MALELNEGLEEIGVAEKAPDDQWFKMYGAFEKTALEQVVLPRTLRALGKSTFKHCAALSVVVLQEGLETIGAGCFWKCPLREVCVPASVRLIDNHAFHGCRELRDRKSVV